MKQLRELIGIKSLSKWTQITGVDISDGVVKRYGLKHSTNQRTSRRAHNMDWEHDRWLDSLKVDGPKGDALLKPRGTYVASTWHLRGVSGLYKVEFN